MRIRSGNRTLVVALLAGSVMTLALGGLWFWLKQREAPLEFGCATMFVGAFIAAGVALGLIALRLLLSMVRYGSWELECADEGGVVGRPMPVRLHAPRPVTPTGDVKLTLRCVEGTTHNFRNREGNEQRTDWRTLHTTDSTVPSGPLGPGQPLVLTLDLPGDLPASPPAERGSRADAGGVTILWQLVVEVPAEGGGPHMTFDLPVRSAG